MVEPIAAPIGVFKSGPSGAGNGDFVPIDGGQGWIRRDILQRNHILFGLMFNESAPTRNKESVIIDLIFDGDKSRIVHDPQLKTSELVTDNPAHAGEWYCPAELPRYVAFSAPGIHKLTVMVAPRPAPVAGTTNPPTLIPRDFSVAAGGVVDTYTWEIKPSDYPMPAAPDYG